MPRSRKLRKKAAQSPRAPAAPKPAQGAASLEALLDAIHSTAADPEDDPIEAAQSIIYDAWEAATKKRRVALALKALAISPHCADAYVLLAQEEAQSLEQAHDLYEQGVKAGEKALGPQRFKEYRGHFWGFLETRPYMRARAGLALTLAQLGDLKGAISHYNEMLKLNKNDNQGIRYLLAATLMQQEDFAALKALFKKYKDDSSAEWLYSRALIAFRDAGESEAANVLGLKALHANAHVAAALAGKSKSKPRKDDYITMGGVDEAAYYLEHWGKAWRSTDGAIDWLLRISAQSGRAAGAPH